MPDKSRLKAKLWVSRAIDFYKSSGREIAIAEFTNPKGPFVQEEMYIFILDTNGIMIAHGINEKYIGKNFIDIQDPTGRSFVREIIESTRENGCGWVDYQWFNPVTRKIQIKSVYFELVDDLIFCSGIYIGNQVDFISGVVPGAWTG